MLRRGMAYSLQLGIAAMIALACSGPGRCGSWIWRTGWARARPRRWSSSPCRCRAIWSSVAAQFFLEALGRPKPGMGAMWIANARQSGAEPAAGARPAGPRRRRRRRPRPGRRSRADVAGGLPGGLYRPPARGAGAGRVRQARRDPAAEREQRKIGYGAGSSYFIEVGAFAAMTFIAGQLGAIETAAWTIVLNVSAIVFMVPMGLSSATAVLVGRRLWRRRRARRAEGGTGRDRRGHRS